VFVATTDDERLWTPAETADYLQVTDSTLRRWRREGIGPAWLKLGRTVRYRPSDVRAWLAAREHKGD
jgi:excisionase family DNA binding protein